MLQKSIMNFALNKNSIVYIQREQMNRPSSRFALQGLIADYIVMPPNISSVTMSSLAVNNLISDSAPQTDNLSATGNITNLGAPTSETDLASKSYVDGLVSTPTSVVVVAHLNTGGVIPVLDIPLTFYKEGRLAIIKIPELFFDSPGIWITQCTSAGVIPPEYLPLDTSVSIPLRAVRSPPAVDLGSLVLLNTSGNIGFLSDISGFFGWFGPGVGLGWYATSASYITAS
jgi:hypothetical protein